MTNEKESFNLKDLINIDDLKEYTNNLDNTEKIDETENKEEIRRRLKEKINNLKGNRLNKNLKEQNKIQQLRENPMFKNIDNNVDMKSMIEKMATSMSKDSKQKKNIKKQMEGLIEKMKNTTI
jgi:hypothetical protein